MFFRQFQGVDALVLLADSDAEIKEELAALQEMTGDFLRDLGIPFMVEGDAGQGMFEFFHPCPEGEKTIARSVVNRLSSPTTDSDDTRSYSSLGMAYISDKISECRKTFLKHLPADINLRLKKT